MDNDHPRQADVSEGFPLGCIHFFTYHLESTQVSDVGSCNGLIANGPQKLIYLNA